jgi:uncharacterized membrane protein
VTDLVLALGIGLVSGLRTFTSLAAVFLVRGGVVGVVLGVAALGEYVYDLSPNCQSRTLFPSNVARMISGAIAAWFLVASRGGSPVLGAVDGIVGALIGTYGGAAVRSAMIVRLGAVPAGIVESLVAIALAAFIVTR